MNKQNLSALFLMLAAACGGDENFDREGNGMPNEDTAFLLGSDNESSGLLSTLGIPDFALDSNAVEGVASIDGVLRSAGNRLFIINRFGADNITILDRATLGLEAQLSTGSGSNPQDVAVVGDSLYVCTLGTGDVQVFDLTDTDAAPATIDVSALDEDGVPDCNSIALAGGLVFATFSLFDAEFASNGAVVAVIDPSDNTLTETFELSTPNPFGFLVGTEPGSGFGGDLLVATVDFNDENAGCIQRIEVDPPAAGGCLVDNSDLGGYASKLLVAGDNVTALVNLSFTETQILDVSSAGVVQEETVTPDISAEQLVTDLVRCPSGHTITNDQNTGTIVVYDESGQSVEDGPFDIGLPPVFANGMVCL